MINYRKFLKICLSQDYILLFDKQVQTFFKFRLFQKNGRLVFSRELTSKILLSVSLRKIILWQKFQLLSSPLFSFSVTRLTLPAICLLNDSTNWVSPCSSNIELLQTNCWKLYSWSSICKVSGRRGCQWQSVLNSAAIRFWYWNCWLKSSSGSNLSLK